MSYGSPPSPGAPGQMGAEDQRQGPRTQVPTPTSVASVREFSASKVGGRIVDGMRPSRIYCVGEPALEASAETVTA